MKAYLESIKARDPAAKSILSIILTYPGVKAVFFHKIANFFYKRPSREYLRAKNSSKFLVFTHFLNN